MMNSHVVKSQVLLQESKPGKKQRLQILPGWRDPCKTIVHLLPAYPNRLPLNLGNLKERLGKMWPCGFPGNCDRL